MAKHQPYEILEADFDGGYPFALEAEFYGHNLAIDRMLEAVFADQRDLVHGWDAEIERAYNEGTFDAEFHATVHEHYFRKGFCTCDEGNHAYDLYETRQGKGAFAVTSLIVRGELYPCDKTVFQELYDLIEGGANHE